MSSSSAVPQCRPRVSELLSKLIAAQSMDTRLWLRAEMVRLVDPMINSFFLRLLISSSAQPSKQTNSSSTMSELSQLIEGEKETTNRLVRGQMDRLVNSLFLRLTNKALVNTEVSAFASVQPSPSNHQTVPPNASIAQSSTVTNNSNEHLSTHQITCPPMISSSLSDGQNANVLIDEFDEGEFLSDYVECEDCEKGFCRLDDENDAETEVDTQIEFDEDEIEDQEQNASLESDLMVMPNVIDNSNQSADNTTDLSLINKSEHQIRSVRKSNRNASKQNSENGQSAQSVIEHNHQSTPSTSGLRSSARKRSLKKVFGYAQSNVRKNGKRKQILDDDDGNVHQEDHSNNSIGEQSIATECTTNPIQPNLAQSNRHLQCSHCPKSFNRKFFLQQHLRVHTGERPFHCDLCDKRFNQKSNLTKHQLIHQNIKRFRCPECDKQFTYKHSLDIHLLTHFGERPFECRHCEKSFTQLGHRTKHEQAIHLHVKPYRCKQCGLTATHQSSVIRHIREVHFGSPRTIKQQRAINIVEKRDPRELIEKV